MIIAISMLIGIVLAASIWSGLESYQRARVAVRRIMRELAELDRFP